MRTLTVVLIALLFGGGARAQSPETEAGERTIQEFFAARSDLQAFHDSANKTCADELVVAIEKKIGSVENRAELYYKRSEIRLEL